MAANATKTINTMMCMQAPWFTDETLTLVVVFRYSLLSRSGIVAQLSVVTAGG
jgi:hypothetical protein